jgi:hypothetical protein
LVPHESGAGYEVAKLGAHLIARVFEDRRKTEQENRSVEVVPDGLELAFQVLFEPRASDLAVHEALRVR